MELFTNQLKRELLRGVAFFIDDSKTFLSFACASQLTYQLTKEFVPYKKKQFSKYIIHDCYIFPVLPNGDIHGVHELDNQLIECKNGVLIQDRHLYLHTNYYIINYNTARFKFTKHLVIKTYLPPFQQLILLINQRNDKQITALICETCNKHHTFLASTYTSAYILRWNCFGRNRKILMDSGDRSNFDDKRGQLAFALVKYLRNNNNKLPHL